MPFKRNNNKSKKLPKIFKIIIWKTFSKRWKKCKMKITRKTS